MKTVLPLSIDNIPEAMSFLNALNENGEIFNPDDDATDLSEDLFTQEEGEELNELMGQIMDLPIFDPHAYILHMDKDYSGKDISFEEFVAGKETVLKKKHIVSFLHPYSKQMASQLSGVRVYENCYFILCGLNGECFVHARGTYLKSTLAECEKFLYEIMKGR